MDYQVVGYLQGQVERFHRSYHVNEDNQCWEWRNALNPDGYGRCYFNNKQYRAHRLSYSLHNNVTLTDELVCHKCDNPKCVNPSHLYLGTQQDNMKDKLIRQRAVGINKGSQNGMSKLTDQEAIEIMDLLKSQLFSQKFIATKYKIDQSHVSRMSSGTVGKRDRENKRK